MFDPGVGAWGNGSLRFDCVPNPQDRLALVTVINTSGEPFSGFSGGWWHAETRSGKAGKRLTGVGGAPFALRLPPLGHVTLETQVGLETSEELSSCYTVFRKTPAPVFELSASGAPVGVR